MLKMQKDGEPGSARHGNFINYYSFNPPDRRLSLIPKSMLSDIGNICKQQHIYALDIGCNSGDLTQALHRHLTDEAGDQDLHILGIDLDPVLINRCHINNTRPGHITYNTADISKSADRIGIIQAYLDCHEHQKFDIVFCFSVTMWVHLNEGDAGLRSFLEYVSSIGQFLVVEPQPWKCYRSAVRRTKKLNCQQYELFPTLEWRQTVDSDIEHYLQEHCGMKLQERFGQTEWERTVCLLEATSLQ